MSDKPVIVVGAGLSGLACAIQLSEAGVACRVFEKGDSVGGRVATENVDGFLLDRGFQVLLTAYPDARDMLDYRRLRLGRFEPGALVRWNGKFHYFVDPWRRPANLFSTATSPIGTLADKLRVAKLRRQVCAGELDDLLQKPESRTIDALKSFGFSDQIIERFFRPFLGGVFLERELNTSSRKFEFVFRMFSEGEAALPREGMNAIAQQLAAKLPSEVVQTNTPVRAIDSDSVTLEDGTQIDAAAVVVATDQTAGDELLNASSHESGHAVNCLYYGADEAPIKERLLVLNGDGEGPINNLCVPSRIVNSYAPAKKSLISVTSLPGDFDSEDQLEQGVRDQLRSWFGSAVDSWRHLKTVHVSNALPQQSPPSSAAEKSVCREDGVYVCGDYLDLASIQGALSSGRHVAERLKRDLR